MTDNIATLSKAKAVLRGAVCGDIIGSPYERHSTKDYNFALDTPFSRFTDDTVCSIAIAETLVSGLPVAATYYGVIPDVILSCCMQKLPEEMRRVISAFDLVIEKKHGK